MSQQEIDQQNCQQLQKMYLELNEQYEIHNQCLKKEIIQNQSLMLKKNNLINQNLIIKKIIQTIQLIKDVRSKKIKKYNRKVESLTSDCDKNKNIYENLKKVQYFHEIPKVSIKIPKIQVPSTIKQVQKKLTDDFKQQKQMLKDQITKLKIMIKLSEIDLQDVQSQTSKRSKAY